MLEVTGQYQYPRTERVHWGRGALALLPREVDRVGARKALIITGNTLANKTGQIKRIAGLLDDRYAGVFHHTHAHPTRELVLQVATAIRETGADLLISVGGSSMSDIAKAANLASTEGLTSVEDFDPYRNRYSHGQGRQRVRLMANNPMPLIVVPTLLSAGDFTPSAGIVDSVTHAKQIFVDPRLVCRVAILDPEVTVDSPTDLWLSTGVKALDHAVEAICSIRHSPITDAPSEKAIAMLFRALPRSKEAPEDLDARLDCLMAAWIAIQGSYNALMGLSHALGHQLGAHCGIPHGKTSCITIPGVLEYNLPATIERQAMIARAAGVADRATPDDQAGPLAAGAVRDLVQRLGLPGRLRDVGVSKDKLPLVARDAMEDRSLMNNPRKVKDAAEVQQVLARMW